MLDAIVFEQLGIPSAAILTEPFIPTAKSLAEIRRMPAYPFVVLPHPITSLNTEQVLERADWATDWVESLLVDGSLPPETADTAEVASDNESKVEQLIRELARPLRADGADLLSRVCSEKSLELELVLTDSACAECIMPGPYLRQLYAQRITQTLGEDWELTLHDPRESLEPS